MPHPDKIYAQQLVDFCYESPTAFHAVASSKKILEETISETRNLQVLKHNS